jgi:hypothetical protein
MSKAYNPTQFIIMVGGARLQDFAQTENAIRIDNEDSAAMAKGVNSAIPTFQNTNLMTIEMDFASWSNENNILAALQKLFQGGPLSSVLAAAGITNPNLGNVPFTMQFKNSTEFLVATTNYVIKRVGNVEIPTTKVDGKIRTWIIETVMQPQDFLGATGYNYN